MDRTDGGGQNGIAVPTMAYSETNYFKMHPQSLSVRHFLAIFLDARFAN